MQISREPRSAVTVRHVAPGEIRIGQQTLTHNVVVTPDHDIRDWPTDDVGQLGQNDVDRLLAMQPEMVVLGTGFRPVAPPREVVFAFARRGIGFESMTTPAACRTFNILAQEERRAAAVLIINEP
ncbi:MAG TPA: MTH938/NDUFAF3 family protein [Woeseiaceae bacterium]